MSLPGLRSFVYKYFIKFNQKANIATSTFLAFVINRHQETVENLFVEVDVACVSHIVRNGN
jgi:hypothetical protein